MKRDEIVKAIKKSKKIKPDTKRISLRVDGYLFAKFKLICKKDEITMKDAVEHFMRNITENMD